MAARGTEIKPKLIIFLDADGTLVIEKVDKNPKYATNTEGTLRASLANQLEAIKALQNSPLLDVEIHILTARTDLAEAALSGMSGSLTTSEIVRQLTEKGIEIAKENIHRVPHSPTSAHDFFAGDPKGETMRKIMESRGATDGVLFHDQLRQVHSVEGVNYAADADINLQGIDINDASAMCAFFDKICLMKGVEPREAPFHPRRYIENALEPSEAELDEHREHPTTQSIRALKASIDSLPDSDFKTSMTNILEDLALRQHAAFASDYPPDMAYVLKTSQALNALINMAADANPIQALHMVSKQIYGCRIHEIKTVTTTDAKIQNMLLESYRKALAKDSESVQALGFEHNLGRIFSRALGHFTSSHQREVKKAEGIFVIDRKYQSYFSIYRDIAEINARTPYLSNENSEHLVNVFKKLEDTKFNDFINHEVTQNLVTMSAHNHNLEDTKLLSFSFIKHGLELIAKKEPGNETLKALIADYKDINDIVRNAFTYNLIHDAVSSRKGKDMLKQLDKFKQGFDAQLASIHKEALHDEALYRAPAR